LHDPSHRKTIGPRGPHLNCAGCAGCEEAIAAVRGSG
jgi:hypothetical protein